MKLYYAPGACSLSDHIALHEADIAFEHDRVDLKTKRTEQGEDYAAINPKGYVPALRLDNGELVTENVAILDWIAGQAPALAPPGPMGRTRMLETLAYISAELHKNFAPFFKGGSDEEKGKAGEAIARRLGYLAERMEGDYLFGDRFGVADAYLFVMLLWAKKNDMPLPEPLPAYFGRVRSRASVEEAMHHEGIG